MRQIVTFLAAALIALLATAAFAQVVTINANPVSGPPSTPITLTWSTTGCATGPTASATPANAGWLGTKAASGSQTITVAADTTFALSCTGAVDGRATLTWTNPTTNIDGTPATLSGNRVYTGTSAAALTQAASLIIAATTYSFSGLTPGVHYFAVSAVDGGAESDKSVVVSKTIAAGASATNSAAFDMLAPPNPPSGLVVTVPTAYNLIKLFGATYAYSVGSVPLGTSCGAVKAKGFYTVPASGVTLKRRPLSQTFVAKCA